jgi:hypothetical protein
MFASSIITFGAGVSAAIVMKLASSIDDVLWLSAFLTPRLTPKERFCNVLTYCSVCFLQTCLAFALSRFGFSVIDEVLGGADDQQMSTVRLLTLISGSSLLLYSVYLGIESCQKNNQVPGDQSREGAHVSVALSTSFERTGEVADYKTDNHPALETEEPPEETIATVKSTGMNNNSHQHLQSTRSLAILAFLGSIDDLTLFIPLLVGQVLTMLQLVHGAMIATSMIVLLCICLTRCEIIANILEQIPLVAIVATISFILLVKGIVFMG